MKNQSGTIKTNLELDRVVMGVQVVTGDSQEEVIIFRDRQTLHHNIYIIASTIINIKITIINKGPNTPPQMSWIGTAPVLSSFKF